MREQHGPVMDNPGKTRFGNYVIIHPIDKGGMGEVYLAQQRSAFDRPVAIKIIRADLANDLVARRRFQREAEVSAYLKHEHILPLLEYGEDHGRLFLVTPYIEGGTLAQRLKKGSLTLAEVRQLFVPLVQAVAYIHRRGVIHRDLKPTNVLLDEQDGQVYVRLIDFGIAAIQGKTAGSAPLTTAGNEVGTIAYMAPERLHGVAAPSNDIFSLGVILHQMLTGKLPMGEEFEPMAPPMQYVVEHCMYPDPQQRFASADDVLRNFEQAYQHVIAPPQRPVNRSPLPPVAPPPLPTKQTARREAVALQQSGQLPTISEEDSPTSMRPLSSGPRPETQPFTQDDYAAPTTALSSSQFLQPLPAEPLEAAPFTSRPPLRAAAVPAITSAPAARRRRRSLLPLISAVMLIIVLAIAFLGYYVYSTVNAAAVTINFSPKVVAVSYAVPMTASIKAQQVDMNTATLPARGFVNSKTGSQSKDTTGKVNCVFGIFNCVQGVSQNDIDTLITQIQPQLETQIKQALQNQVAAARGTLLTPVNFTIVSETSNPLLNQPGTTVTVTMVEQGSVGYILTDDANNVARLALTQRMRQQAGPGYVMINSTVTLGKPVVQSVDGAGNVKIVVAAGGDAVYQFSRAQLQAIQNGLKGKSVTNARAFLASQPGIDPASITIHFTNGQSGTLPNDIQHITIVPINASVFPAVQLPKVSAATITPTTTAITPTPATPVNTPTPSVTPQGD